VVFLEKKDEEAENKENDGQAGEQPNLVALVDDFVEIEIRGADDAHGLDVVPRVDTDQVPTLLEEADGAFATWEEITELLFVAGAAAILLIFRHALFYSTPGARISHPTDSRPRA